MDVEMKRHVVQASGAVLALASVAGCLWAASSRYPYWQKLNRWYERRFFKLPDELEDEEAEADAEQGVCAPLRTPTQLLQWQPPSPPALDPTACKVQLVPMSSQQELLGTAARPQLLVCHDMMGGYLDDKHPTGADNPDFYSMWHWDCVDIFVYFSHHMVTIPPVGWIAAAHRHGTKVLGTFITEWALGAHRCARLFKDLAAAQAVADQLVAIAQHYGFEGWLINIENHLSEDGVQMMLHFLGYLRARLHAEVAHGTVIWYDAVNMTGKLEWQNTITALNQPFFDMTDGLFINYKWEEASAQQMSELAGSRRPQVYLGIDVHGRGSFGGGGWNCDVALAAAKADGLSAALFAPGWVYENLEKSQFQQLQHEYWSKVSAAWGGGRLQVTSLPFSSSFNQGQGLAFFKAGAPRPLGGWWDLGAQELLPPLGATGMQAGIPLKVKLTKETAYQGGTSLEVIITSPAVAAAAQAAAACSRVVAQFTRSSSSSNQAANVLGGFEPVVSLVQLYRLDGNLISAAHQGSQQYEISVVMASQLKESWSVQLVLWLMPEQQQEERLEVSVSSMRAGPLGDQMQDQRGPRKLLNKHQGKQQEQERRRLGQPGSPSKQQQEQTSSTGTQPDSPQKLERDAVTIQLPGLAGPGARLQKAHPVLITPRKGRLSSIFPANVCDGLPEAGGHVQGNEGAGGGSTTANSVGSTSQVMWVGAQAAAAYREEVLGPLFLLPAGGQSGTGGSSYSNADEAAAAGVDGTGAGGTTLDAVVSTDVHWVQRSWWVRPCDWPGQQVVAMGLGLVAVGALPRPTGQAGKGESAGRSCSAGEACEEEMQRLFVGTVSLKEAGTS